MLIGCLAVRGNIHWGAANYRLFDFGMAIRCVGRHQAQQTSEKTNNFMDGHWPHPHRCGSWMNYNRQNEFSQISLVDWQFCTLPARKITIISQTMQHISEQTQIIWLECIHLAQPLNHDECNLPLLKYHLGTNRHKLHENNCIAFICSLFERSARAHREQTELKQINKIKIVSNQRMLRSN